MLVSFQTSPGAPQRSRIVGVSQARGRRRDRLKPRRAAPRSSNLSSSFWCPVSGRITAVTETARGRGIGAALAGEGERQARAVAAEATRRRSRAGAQASAMAEAISSRFMTCCVQRPVAALGRGQPPALGGDRAALHAVGVVDDHVDVALARARRRGSRRRRPGTSSARSRRSRAARCFCTRMWLGASSRVALPEMKTLESLSKVYLPSGLG